MPKFERFIGIDYSGAQTSTSSLSGLRVYAADWLLPPKEVPPRLVRETLDATWHCRVARSGTMRDKADAGGN